MSNRTKIAAPPLLVLFGLASCGTDDTATATTTTASPIAEETQEEIEVPAAVETEGPAPTPTETDYPERGVLPEEAWGSNFFTASELASRGMHQHDPYEFHRLVDWEPDTEAELEPSGKSFRVCSYDELYWGYFYLDQSIEQFAGEETSLDDLIVQYNARDGRGNMDIVVSIPVTCDSWADIVDYYKPNPNISPNQVLLSEEVAYSIADIDGLAEREIRDSHEYNPLDIRDTERVHQIYYRLVVLD